MPNYFTGHIDKWLLLSESETDFAIHFVRAWIPFNAWYCNNYNDTRDRNCIDQIKDDNNQFRARLIALLGNGDNEAIRFRSYLGQLHQLLENFPIPDASQENRITFKSIYFRLNPYTVTTPILTKRNLNYKVERLANNSIVANILPTSSPAIAVYNYSYTRYDVEHFKSDVDSSSLTIEQRKWIEKCYEEVNPRKKENLISKVKRNSIDAGGVYFIEDKELLSKAIIELLYGLRCKLFHGELQPSKDNLSIYEPAYHILRILIKSLQ